MEHMSQKKISASQVLSKVKSLKSKKNVSSSQKTSKYFIDKDSENGGKSSEIACSLDRFCKTGVLDESSDFMECESKNKFKSIKRKAEECLCEICKQDITSLDVYNRGVHVNNCMDKQMPSTSSIPSTQPAEDDNIFILECPLCFKSFSSPELRANHIKKCGKSKGLDTQSVIKALELQERHALERVALGLPAKPVKVAKVQKNPNKKAAIEPKSKAQSDIQLAKALSLSLNNTTEVSSNDASSKIMLRPLDPHKIPGKKPNKNKKNPSVTPLLVLRSDDERKKLLLDKVASILAPVTEEETEVLVKEPKLSEILDKNPAKLPVLWDLSKKSSEKYDYYVEPLLDWIQPSDVEVGPKLLHLSQIAGHEILTQLPLDYTFSQNSQTQVSSAGQIGNTEKPASPVLNCLQSLVASSFMSDVNISTSCGTLIPAHKLILAVRCPPLKQNLDFCSSSEKVTLKWGNVSFDAAIQFLDFIYSGNIEIKEEIVPDLLCLVKKYEMHDLKAILNSHMKAPSAVESESNEKCIGAIGDEKSNFLHVESPPRASVSRKSMFCDTQQNLEIVLDYINSDTLSSQFPTQASTPSCSMLSDDPREELFHDKDRSVSSMLIEKGSNDSEGTFNGNASKSNEAELIPAVNDCENSQKGLVSSVANDSLEPMFLEKQRDIDTGNDSHDKFMPSSPVVFDVQETENELSDDDTVPFPSCSQMSVMKETNCIQKGIDLINEKSSSSGDSVKILNLPVTKPLSQVSQKTRIDYDLELNSSDLALSSASVEKEQSLKGNKSRNFSKQSTEIIMSKDSECQRPQLGLLENSKFELPSTVVTTIKALASPQKEHSFKDHELRNFFELSIEKFRSKDSDCNDSHLDILENSRFELSSLVNTSIKTSISLTDDKFHMHDISSEEISRPSFNSDKAEEYKVNSAFVDDNIIKISDDSNDYPPAHSSTHDSHNLESKKISDSKSPVKMFRDSSNCSVDSDDDSFHLPLSQRVMVEKSTVERSSPVNRSISPEVLFCDTSNSNDSVRLSEHKISVNSPITMKMSSTNYITQSSSAMDVVSLTETTSNTPVKKDISLKCSVNNQISNFNSSPSQRKIVGESTVEHSSSFIKRNSSPVIVLSDSSNSNDSFFLSDLKKASTNSPVRMKLSPTNSVEKSRKNAVVRPGVICFELDGESSLIEESSRTKEVSSIIRSDLEPTILFTGINNEKDNLDKANNSGLLKTSYQFMNDFEEPYAYFDNVSFSESEHVSTPVINKSTDADKNGHFSPDILSNLKVTELDIPPKIYVKSKSKPTSDNPVKSSIESFGGSTSETPKRNVKIKDKVEGTPLSSLPQFRFSDSPITPFPDYKSMVSPDIKEALKKYGVKGMCRKKAVALLSHIYDETHPLLNGEAAGSSVALSPKKKSKSEKVSKPRKRKNAEDAAKTTKKITPKEVHPTATGISLSSDSEDSSSENSEAKRLGYIPEISFSQCSQTQNSPSKNTADDLEQIKMYIMGSEQLYSNILNYVPLNLVELSQELKTGGIKISIQKLMDFLDEQCITFTCPRKEEYKKKQTARANRFRKNMIAKMSQQAS